GCHAGGDRVGRDDRVSMPFPPTAAAETATPPLRHGRCLGLVLRRHFAWQSRLSSRRLSRLHAPARGEVMKLRIRGNSIRIRVDRKDVAELLDRRRVVEVLRFGPGSTHTFTYAV